jgi:hypothetical protein
MILQNIDKLPTNYRVSHLKRQNSPVTTARISELHKVAF